MNRAWILLLAVLLVLLAAFGWMSLSDGDVPVGVGAPSDGAREDGEVSVVALHPEDVRSSSPGQESEPPAEVSVQPVEQEPTQADSGSRIDEGPYEYLPAMAVGSEEAEKYASGLEKRIEALEKAIEAGRGRATAAVHAASLAVAATLSLQGRARFVEEGAAVSLTPRENEYRFMGINSSLFIIDPNLEFTFLKRSLDYQAGELFGEAGTEVGDLDELLSEVLTFGDATLEALGR